VEGIIRFVRATFPLLRKAVPGARLVVAGSGPPPALASLVAATEGAELIGDVDDVEPLYRRARCFVDVGVGGAGTRVKLLNALARGLPAVAVSDAVEGLEAVPGEHLLVADDPVEVAGRIVRLLTDDDAWRSIRDRGRELIRSRYVPAIAFSALDEALSGDRSAPPRRSA
jgi:glycosyltransferase involved in cell wall biosynthesis